MRLPPRASAFADAIRARALAYPETREESPWGHSAFKVKGKTFVFLSSTEEGLSLSTKLPRSRGQALEFAFAEPTRYGLGRSGWVTATFGVDDEPPLDLLFAWVDESYRALAPKGLVAKLPSPGTALPSATRTATTKRATSTKRAAAAKRAR